MSVQANVLVAIIASALALLVAAQAPGAMSTAYWVRNGTERFTAAPLTLNVADLNE